MAIGNVLGVGEEVRSFKESKRLVSNDFVGIEVELENLPDVDRHEQLKYWKITEDGSLRNHGLEFIFRMPFNGMDIESAIDELITFLSKHSPEQSERTSLHVHLDVRDLDWVQLKRLGIIYSICEKMYYRVSGHRDNNLFCLSFEHAERSLATLGGLTDNDRHNGAVINAAGREQLKYAGLNLVPVATQGSVEFRHHSGTLDKDELILWVNAILSLKKAAREREDNYEDMILSVSERGYLTFFDEVFGSVSEQLKYPELEFDLMQGMSLAQDIIYNDKFGAEHFDPKYLVEVKNVDTPYMKFLKKKHRTRFDALIRDEADDDIDDIMETYHEFLRDIGVA